MDPESPTVYVHHDAKVQQVFAHRTIRRVIEERVAREQARLQLQNEKKITVQSPESPKTPQQ